MNRAFIPLIAVLFGIGAICTVICVAMFQNPEISLWSSGAVGFAAAFFFWATYFVLCEAQQGGDNDGE